MNLSLTFVLLSFFFGPMWVRLSGGGEMNPAVLSMKWSMGKTGLFDWLVGCVCIVLGYVIGIICAAAAIDVPPSLPHPRSAHDAPLPLPPPAHVCAMEGYNGRSRRKSSLTESARVRPNDAQPSRTVLRVRQAAAAGGHGAA